MRIAHTDLVNFMIDDLVENSLGFLKGKKITGQEKEEEMRDLATRYRVCTTEEYFMHYQYSRLYCYTWYARGNYRK